MGTAEIIILVAEILVAAAEIAFIVIQRKRRIERRRRAEIYRKLYDRWNKV